MKSSNRMIVAILIVAVFAIGFWMLALGPKREKAAELSKEVDSLNVTLAQAQSAVQAAEIAKQQFPDDYRQLVTLGEAVPAADETSSLLVELNEIATDSKVKFESIQLSGAGEGGVVETAPVAPPAEAPPAESSTGVPAAATVPPTEAAASLLPLGAAIGPAGLAVMPYNLTFSGNFFQIADFIEGIDSLVETRSSSVGTEGRLVTIDGFALNPSASESGGALEASFVVTTYVTPPGLGVTAGASPTEPAPTAPTEASSSAAPETSEEVSAR